MYRLGEVWAAWDTTSSHRNQEPWIKGFDLTAYAGEIHEDGIGRMIEIIETSPIPVTIIAIGPAVNLAAALARAPGIAARCRLVGMFGSFDLGYDGAPRSERGKPTSAWCPTPSGRSCPRRGWTCC
jgi:inosine-uridine nucleoside N-ribohydrolase